MTSAYTGEMPNLSAWGNWSAPGAMDKILATLPMSTQPADAWNITHLGTSGGYTKFDMPAANSGYDNKYDTLNSLYNPANKVRDNQGNLLSGSYSDKDWGASYYVPNESYSNITQPFDQNPQQHKGLFGGGILGTLAPIALGFALGPAGLGLSGIGGGALAGGITSAVSGGNVLKGAALGGLGGGISNYANANFSANPANGAVGISPAQFASTAGRTGLSMLAGQNPTQAILGGAGSLAGTSAASNFDNPWLKNLAGTSASTAVRGGDIGNAAIGSLLGTTSQYGASQTDNPWLKNLALSSPKLLSQLMSNSQPNAQQAPQQAQQLQQAKAAQMPAWVSQAMVALGKKGYSEAQAKQMIQQHGQGV